MSFFMRALLAKHVVTTVCIIPRQPPPNGNSSIRLSAVSKGALPPLSHFFAQHAIAAVEHENELVEGNGRDVRCPSAPPGRRLSIWGAAILAASRRKLHVVKREKPHRVLKATLFRILGKKRRNLFAKAHGIEP